MMAVMGEVVYHAYSEADGAPGHSPLRQQRPRPRAIGRTPLTVLPVVLVMAMVTGLQAYSRPAPRPTAN